MEGQPQTITNDHRFLRRWFFYTLFDFAENARAIAEPLPAAAAWRFFLPLPEKILYRSIKLALLVLCIF